jgi:2-polyprenyl-6-methoxyphenol hydroxylase-like FAD-dependent oxidoreductase
MASPVRATIVGGGIAGLATGVALKRIGYQVRVIEKRKVLETLPQGLTLQPAAVNALERISPSLKESVLKMGQKSGDISLFSSVRGSTIGKLEQDELVEAYGAPFITVPRQEFYATLVKELGVENIELGKQFKEYFEDRKSGQCRAICIGGSEFMSDIIIGAEGAYSMISEMIPRTFHPRPQSSSASLPRDRSQ